MMALSKQMLAAYPVDKDTPFVERWSPFHIRISIIVRLLILLLFAITITSCKRAQSNVIKIESCEFVQAELSSDGQSAILIETSPSAILKLNSGLETRFSFERAVFDCIDSECFSKQNGLTLPTRMKSPHIFWVYDQSNDVLGTIFMDQHSNQNAVFLPLNGSKFIRLKANTYSLPKRTEAISSDGNWSYMSPLFLASSNGNSEVEIKLEIETLLQEITKIFDSFSDDFQSVSSKGTFQKYIQNSEGVIGSIGIADYPQASNIVYDAQKNSTMTMTNHSPVNRGLELYSTQDEALVLSGVNRATYVNTSNTVPLIEKFEYPETLRTYPIEDSATGQFAGISSINSIQLIEGNVGAKGINNIIIQDRHKNPNLTIQKVDYTDNEFGATFLIEYKNWKNGGSVFKYVKIPNDTNIKPPFEAFLPCPASRLIKPSVSASDIRLVVNIQSIGSEKWPSRVFSIAQKEPVGAVVFLKGGPRGTVFDEPLSKRVYKPYIELGYDVYAFEYSGMTLPQSELDQRLHLYHEKALINDIKNMRVFASEKLEANYDNIVLHSESFGSIIGLSLLAQDNPYTSSIFVSPWVSHHSPTLWQDDPRYQLAYEEYMFGIQSKGRNEFVDWMKLTRDQTLSLSNSLVIYGERENRGPLNEMYTFFKDRGAKVHLINNASHATAPALGQNLIDQFLWRTNIDDEQK